ncbi:hypothetical protein A2U01_0065610 [Trifolium medium]|uniref:Uncharacterized protein n=1 Tax=Trifolium medium TaxID=97028 RepID=A0A392S651_9FABA|nr:hypothetical protein [Trifolium medium]
MGSFQRPDSVELVWDLAYAAVADAEGVADTEDVAGLTGFVMVSAVADAVDADAVVADVVVDVVAEAVAGLTGFLMVSPDPGP